MFALSRVFLRRHSVPQRRGEVTACYATCSRAKPCGADTLALEPTGGEPRRVTRSELQRTALGARKRRTRSFSRTRYICCVSD